VAIVGPSGAGKSTLAHLLLRFWEYDAGEIRLGQQSVRSLPANAVRARIGYVSQHPYIFDTSILENLRLARRRPSQADLEQAARRAALHEFIESLPAGYETLIGEHGAMLSAGQRQRLGLARVILKDAPILILDEPTANLDAQNEAHILDGLLEFARKRTCLFITHRLRRMEDFDNILVMEHGAIRERGSHGTLLAAGGLYTRLWTLQNGLRLPSGGRLANSL
jgi:ABC-type multidrug transport system fused ATPase/permease subunit